MKLFKNYLIIVHLFVFSIPAISQICAPPVVDQYNNYGYDLAGIGDGCTLRKDYGAITINAEWIPNIFFFKGTFTGSCNRHDKCLTQIGNTAGACNSEFYSNMRSACDSKYPWYRPVERDLCRQTAYQYYQTVQLSINDSTATYLQTASLSASFQIKNQVDSDTCGTTPERIQLYSGSLISEIYSMFQTYAGRLPTIYEFLNAATSLNYLNNREQWRANLQLQASNSFYIQIPSVSYTANSDWGLTLFANPVSSANYMWKVNGKTSYSSTINLVAESPMYDMRVSAQGFLKIDYGNIASRNMLVIDQAYNLRGDCAQNPGLPCN